MRPTCSSYGSGREAVSRLNCGLAVGSLSSQTLSTSSRDLRCKRPMPWPILSVLGESSTSFINSWATMKPAPTDAAATAGRESHVAGTPTESPTAWKNSPALSLDWRLERVRAYLSRLPLTRARGIVYGSVGRRAFGMASDPAHHRTTAGHPPGNRQCLPDSHMPSPGSASR